MYKFMCLCPFLLYETNAFIQPFHSRGRERLYIRKELYSNRICLDHRHGRHEFMWKRSMPDVARLRIRLNFSWPKWWITCGLLGKWTFLEPSTPFSRSVMYQPLQSLPFSPRSKRRFHLYCKSDLTLEKVINKKLKQKEYNYEEI